MKKSIAPLLAFLCLGLTGCSTAAAEGDFEKELPQNIMEMIDAGWIVQENYAIEPNKEHLNEVWAKDSGIEDFHWVYSILFTKEIDGIEKYCIVSKFGSAEQAKYYKDNTDFAYTNAVTATVGEFYYSYNYGAEEFKEIFDIQ